MNDMIKKKEGFKGQKAILIPRQVLAAKCARDKIMSALYVTEMGFYPKARFHYRERPQGADQHILIYCHEGKGKVTIQTTAYNIEPGDFFVIPIKTPHTYVADDVSPWTIYWIHFKGQTADNLVLSMKKRLGSKSFIQHNEKSLELFDEMYNQLERGYGTDNLMFANMCLWHFLSTFLYNDKSSAAKLTQKDATDIAIDYLRRNLDKTLTLEDIAREASLSTSHFSYLFKKKTGFSPIEYFNHLKVQKACQYLLFTPLRIKEISQELGIEDQYYFSRMFTKVMSIAPNDYREKRNL